MIWLYTNNARLYPSLFRQMTSDKVPIHCDRQINKLAKNVQYRWFGKTSYTNTSFHKNLSSKWVCTIQFVIKDSLNFLRFLLLWFSTSVYHSFTVFHYYDVIRSYISSPCLLLNIVPLVYVLSLLQDGQAYVLCKLYLKNHILVYTT